MKKNGKQKSFLKLIIVLLIISIIWFFAVLEMLYNTIVSDNNSQLFLLNYSTQLKFVYGIGVILITIYTFIILDKKNTSDRNFN